MARPRTPRSLRAHWLTLCALAFTAACGNGASSSESGPDDPDVIAGDGAEDFISDLPGQNGGDGTGGSNGGSDAGVAAPEGDASSDGAERAIAEADIIKLEGDTLYALSRYSGLSVIDAADPTRLRLLGNHRSKATPFEMYLRDGVAYVMYNEYGSYELDEATGQWGWQSASRLQALDVSDPASIRVLADEEVAGSIADSRMVGNIAYLVTYENGWCWRCETKPNTRVVSFDVSAGTKFARVDELRFESDQGSYQRSISVTAERIYVAGPSWADKDSSIQVVDIADPAGDLKLGAEIPIRGSIASRWQMDEYQGILRVISQPTAWRSNDAPYVQTFKIDSSDAITALASLPIKLPRPETLQSVRFDGPRGYAVTFERTDPLFTFDLTDPAKPKQMGELEIPGFLYHMEPRGDRLYALGFDFGQAQGSLHVSIFDVSNLDAPTMLDRVNFGGDWAHVAEDQDRIHKAFNIMLDQNLILVPFGGGTYDDVSCQYDYQSGIQLVDVMGDELTLRGVAPQLGEARRALLHRDHLFGVTDNAVQVFDISNRDLPLKRAQLETARNISQLHVMGDKLMRFGTDWWTERAILDFTALDQASTAQPLGELDLASVVTEPAKQCNQAAYWEGQVYVHGDTAYVPRREYRQSTGANSWEQKELLTFYIVDLPDRAQPKLVGKLDVEGASNEYLGGVVLTDHALLVGRGEGYYNYNPRTGERSDPKYSYDIFDLKNPRAPRFTKRFTVPSQLATGGWGWGAGGCGVDMGWGWWFSGYGATGALVAGDLVISQHEETVAGKSGRVRYFLDRLDVSDPSAPKLLPPINIPGQAVHFDAKAQRLVTLDYVHSEISASTAEACYGRGQGWYDSTTRTCQLYARRANALTLAGDKAKRISMLMLDDERISSFVAVTNERLFFTTQARGSYNGVAIPQTSLETLAYTKDGQFQVLPSVDLQNQGYWWGQIHARGTRAFIAGDGALTVVNTQDKQAPELKRHDMQGWGCNSLEVHQNRAYCALGQFGVASVDLD